MTNRIQMLQDLVDKGSQDPFVWYALAMEHRSLGHLQVSLSAFEQVAKRFPDYVPTYLMAAQTAHECDNDEIAKRWAERGVEVATAQVDSHALSELNDFLSAL